MTAAGPVGKAAQPPPPPHRVPHCPSVPIPTPAAGPRLRFWDMACLTRPETRSVWARLWPEVFRGGPSSGVGLALAHDVRTRGHRTGQPGGPVARRVTGRSMKRQDAPRCPASAVLAWPWVVRPHRGRSLRCVDSAEPRGRWRAGDFVI